MNDRLFKVMVTVAVLVCMGNDLPTALTAQTRNPVGRGHPPGWAGSRSSHQTCGSHGMRSALIPNDNVYALFGGATETASDCALFQYNAATGKTRLVGTISQALAAAGNLHENEPIPKGHTQLPYVNGKIYIGTMGFHDAVRLGSQQMEERRRRRGAHLLAYDPVRTSSRT